jgi:hypothetical protein
MESLQKQLVTAILNTYSNALPKKVDVDNFLDIHLPDVNNKKGTHLFFNTVGGTIKFGFYCRDNDFVENVINSSDQIERYSQGVRLLNNPQFESVEDAVSNAQFFINLISNKSNTYTSDIDSRGLNNFMKGFESQSDNINQFEEDEEDENDFELEDFDVVEESVIDFISNKIYKGKYLTNLLYVNETLEKNDFEVDNHQAYFFDSDVLISDRELSGFLVVNMDGFYSNCISEDELNMLISWDAVTNLVYSETDNDSSIDIITDQGELTIKKINSYSLKILNTFYISLWKEIIEKFKDEPFINWNEVWQLGVTEIGFNTIQEYKDFKIK